MGLHDKLFKQLIGGFVPEFLALFFPQAREYLDESSLTFLDKEFFTDPGTGKKREADIVARAKFRGQDSFFIINIEGQGRDLKGFQERFFVYSVYLYLKYRVPVYPIVVFYDTYPAAEQPQVYTVGFPDMAVFDFHYRVVQLNRLDWREFVRQANPVASALVARMKMAPGERPLAKLATLELLVGLPLTDEQKRLISSFIDTYLDLDEQEKQIFQQLLAEIRPEQKEEVMELTTSWKREGIQQGIQIGKEQGQREATLNLVTRQLQRRFGAAFVSHEQQLEHLTLAQLEDLGEALLDFKDTGDLAQWLARQG